MKLKLSNLLAIIAVIFFLYYYFIHVPREQAKAGEPVVEEEGPEMAPLPELENGVTPLLPPRGNDHENFSVTPIDTIINTNQPVNYGYTDYPTTSLSARANSYNADEIYDVAGNIRPDNVMFAGNEPATSF